MQLQVAPDDVVTGVVDIEDRQAKPACEGSHRPRPAPRHPAGRSTSAPDVAASGGPPVRRTSEPPRRAPFRRRAGPPRSHRSRHEEPPQGPGGPRLAAERAAVVVGSTGAGVERRHQVGARESIARERPCSHGQEECPRRPCRIHGTSTSPQKMVVHSSGIPLRAPTDEVALSGAGPGQEAAHLRPNRPVGQPVGEPSP